MSGGPAAAADAGDGHDAPPARLRARGLTLLSILAVALAPFSLPTFGAGAFLGAILVATSAVLLRRGVDARRPLAAGIVALALSAASAGACGWLVLRVARVEGREAAQQGRVESGFDRAFDEATRAPPSRSTGDAGTAIRPDSQPR